MLFTLYVYILIHIYIYIYISLSITYTLHVVHAACLCFFYLSCNSNDKRRFSLQKDISHLVCIIIDTVCIFCAVETELCDIVQVRCALHKGDSLNLAGAVCECCFIHLTVLTTRNSSVKVLVYPVLSASALFEGSQTPPSCTF